MSRKLLDQTIDLGPRGSFTKFNEASLPQGGKLGAVAEHKGRLFRLVKFDDGVGNVASIDGGVLYWKDRANFVVTADASDAEGLADGIAGGCHVVAADGNYIFAQCGGDQAAVVVAALAVNGDHLTGSATVDNELVRTAAGTAAPNKQAGTALSTRGATTSDNGVSVANSSKVRWIFGALL